MTDNTPRPEPMSRLRCDDCHEPIGGKAICERCAACRCESVAQAVSTPAGEVTADAVTIAEDAFNTSVREQSGNAAFNRKRAMQAALAAAFPVLVQQVERLRAELEAVNGAIGGKYTFFKERHGVGHQTTKALSQLIDLIAKKRDVATAQAKQAEGDNV